MIDNIDLDVSKIITGEKSIESMGNLLFDELVEVANGKLTKAEILGFSDICIDRICRFL